MKNKMVKIISSIFLVTLVLILVGQAWADNELLLGQKHNYTVTFRGNGEAVVYSRIVVSNNNEEQLKNFTFEIPRASVSDLIIFQQKLPKICQKYENYDYSLVSPYAGSSSRKCLEYREPDYTNAYSSSYYYDNSTTEKIEYHKAKYTKAGNAYNFDLPLPIDQNNSTAFIIAYAAKGYTKESFGLFDYNFETIRVDSRISEATVTVDVDSDLYLKGKKSEVNYESSKNSADIAPAMSASTFSSPELDRVVSSIGQTGSIVKTAKNLAANESFSVKGTYAKSWVRLYLQNIIIFSLITIFVLVCLILLGRLLNKKLKNNKTNQNTPSEPALSSEENDAPSRITNHGLLDPVYVITSLVSAVLTVVLAFAISYSSSYLYELQLDGIATLFGVIIVFLLFVLFIFGPAIFVSTKRGWKAFLYIFILEIVWLLLFFVLYTTLFSKVLPSVYYYGGGNI